MTGQAFWASGQRQGVTFTPQSGHLECAFLPGPLPYHQHARTLSNEAIIPSQLAPCQWYHFTNGSQSAHDPGCKHAVFSLPWLIALTDFAPAL
jgi:hypothetical protein